MISNKLDDSVTNETASQIGNFVTSAFEDSVVSWCRWIYKINQNKEIINVTTKRPWE